MSTITASVARQSLPAQLDRVEAGEEISITRHGRVVAVLVSPDRLAKRRAPEAWRRAEDLGQMLQSARSEPVHPASLTADRAEELIESVRGERSR